MDKGRLEAFSDGVFAIIITIMVLELVPPHGTTLEALREIAPVFLAYVLSFVNVGIYWTNHHHLLHASHVVDGRVLWANLFLLFWRGWGRRGRGRAASPRCPSRSTGSRS